MIRCTEIGYLYESDEEASHMSKWYFAVLDELASLRDIQLNFVGEGVLLRGAVTIASYDIVNGTVFGPALLAALEMEKSIAHFPRIIIDSTISGFIDFIPSKHNLWFSLNLKTDTDGVMFIDYLKGAAFEATWDLWWYAKALEKHKFSLDKLTASRPSNTAIAEKLNWLLNYHNETIKTLEYSVPRNWELDWTSFLTRRSC
jgi:hypothetical protein